MRIVQALHWLKPKLDNPDERHRIQRQLEVPLSNPSQGRALRQDLEAGLATLPLWMQAFVRDLAPMQNRSVPPGKRKAAKPPRPRS
jgi:hypothetical protein